MVSEAVSITRKSHFDVPFIAMCVVAAVASIVAYVQYQRATQLVDALATANDRSAQLQAQISEASSQLKAEAKPDLPLTVGFRPAILGTGLVMELRNNSANELEIAAAFTSEATGQVQRRNLVLPPNRIMNLGSTEGWAFAPGQHVTFSNANYRPAEFIVPPPRQ